MGDTPLIRAARFPGNSEVIQLLIESGADINARQKGGRLANPPGANTSPLYPGDNLTALHCAVLEGVIDNIKVLLLLGAKRDLATSKGNNVSNLLNIALSTNKITQQTFDIISKILQSEKVEFDVMNRTNSAGDFSLDNPFHNVIGGSNQNEKITSLLKSGKLNEQQIKLGFKSATSQGIEVLRLFDTFVPQDMLVSELQSKINILSTSLTRLESERDTYIRQSEQAFDLMHGDTGDRAQALMDYSNFMSMGGKQGYLNPASEIESRIKDVERNIHSYQDYIRELNTKKPFIVNSNFEVASLITNNRSPIFTSSKATVALKNPVLESLLQQANVVPGSNQDKEIVEVKFIDNKLAQQFTEELHKIGISNLGMKNAPRKLEETESGECIILVSADEYNGLTGDNEAYSKLISKLSKPYP